jgi:hypothetical protein
MYCRNAKQIAFENRYLTVRDKDIVSITQLRISLLQELSPSEQEEVVDEESSLVNIVDDKTTDPDHR